ncbi:hypothetical protein EKG83_25360 [Saccharothrix syringae]|uniref:Uncharacterized protein n=1 Tax=Saccharothrix syringae TaxID=103733 RepID=A0A5Q0H3K8_SACSY|nr:hypothetical protein EKG83_25360 [Saccharothrix syringae]
MTGGRRIPWRGEGPRHEGGHDERIAPQGGEGGGRGGAGGRGRGGRGRGGERGAARVGGLAHAEDRHVLHPEHEHQRGLLPR